MIEILRYRQQERIVVPKRRTKPLLVKIHVLQLTRIRRPLFQLHLKETAVTSLNRNKMERALTNLQRCVRIREVIGQVANIPRMRKLERESSRELHVPILMIANMAADPLPSAITFHGILD